MVRLKKHARTIPPITPAYNSLIIVGDLSLTTRGFYSKQRLVACYLIVVGMASRAGTKRKKQLSAARQKKRCYSRGTSYSKT